MLSGRGLCDELITRPEESYRLCCVVVCELETSRIGAPYIYDISNLKVKKRISMHAHTPTHTHTHSHTYTHRHTHTHTHTHGYLRLHVMDAFVISRNPDVLHQLLMYISARMQKICINNLCVSHIVTMALACVFHACVMNVKIFLKFYCPNRKSLYFTLTLVSL